MVDRPGRVPFTVFPTVSRQRRRAFLYLASFAGVLVLYTFAYMWGMAMFEDTPRTVLQAFSVVIETFTTTGYGVDAGNWTTPQMRLLMVTMQISGVDSHLHGPPRVRRAVGSGGASSQPTDDPR